MREPERDRGPLAATRPASLRAEQFPQAAQATQERWRDFGRPGFGGADRVLFPEYMGLRLEEVREGYCRMRMVFRPELMHAGGVVHGGALATVLDSVLMPAIGSIVELDSDYSTVDLHVQYLAPLVDDDCIAEGWVLRRGRRIVFGQAEARAATSGRLVATSALTYHVAPPRSS